MKLNGGCLMVYGGCLMVNGIRWMVDGGCLKLNVFLGNINSDILVVEFSHEKLEVWQLAIELADYGLSLTEEISSKNRHYRLLEQFEQAVSSVSQNIAEGKGRSSKKEYVQYLYISRGSLYESLTLISIFGKRNWITQDQEALFREKAFIIVNKLKGLINAIYNSI